MAEQQLVDYIKKARQAGQNDVQTRTLLLQNGWSDAEINDAIASLNGAQPQVQEKMEQKPLEQKPKEYQVSGQAEVKKPQSQYQAKPMEKMDKTMSEMPDMSYMSEKKSGGGAGRVIATIFIVIVLLAVIGGGAYIALFQQDAVGDFIGLLFPSSTEIQAPVQETPQNSLPPSPEPEPAGLTTQLLASIADSYDISKIAVAAFNGKSNKTVFCAPKKADGKYVCFANNEIVFESPYTFKPYWMGISPNGQRNVFLYYDAVKKQSFVYENGTEGQRYNGTITAPAFTQDSQNFMFMVISNDGKNFVVFDNKAFAPHDKVYTTPELSADGEYVLYGARDGQNMSWVADKINAE